jgi:hypothetical protein
VFVEHAGILNPKRKFRGSVTGNGFTIKYRTANTRAMATGPDEVANVVCSFS